MRIFLLYWGEMIVNKGLRDQKIAFLRGLSFKEKNIMRMSSGELESIMYFFDDSSDLNFKRCIFEKLKAERERLIGKKVPSEKWPKALTDGEWAKTCQNLGFERPLTVGERLSKIWAEQRLEAEAKKNSSIAGRKIN